MNWKTKLRALAIKFEILPPEEASPQQMRIFGERVKLLFGQPITSYFAMAVGAGIIGFLHWDLAPKYCTVTWLIAFLVIVASRVTLQRQFQSTQPSLDEVCGWQVRFIYGSWVHALCWGSAPLVFSSMPSPIPLICLAIILCGVGSGGIVVLGAVFGAGLLFVLLVIGGLITGFLLQGGVFFLMAAITSLYLIILVQALVKTNKVFTSSLTLRFENMELLEYYQSAKDEAEQLNEQLHDALLAEEKANMAKREFLAHISHEIRTPMHGILGVTHLMLEGRLNKTQRDQAALVKLSAEHLLKVINDILDFSKIEAGKLELEMEQVPLWKIIEESTEICKTQAEAKQVEVLLDIDEEVPRCVISDPHRLKQVLINVISNGVKFTPSGGSVTIHADRELVEVSKSMVRFSISDTGIGIPLENREKIFNAFVQADGSVSRKFGGTGLGLSIALKLIKLFKGQISVESCTNIGTIFSIEVPFEHVLNTPQEDVAPKEHSVDVEFKKLSILVVEDNFVNQRLLERLLKKSGHAVKIASNGSEAVAAFQKRNFDLILMDIQMPEMDGIQATAHIRACEQGKDCKVPIVALTAHDLDGDIEQYLEAGMDTYLAKPFSRRDLYQTIASVMERAKRS
ncbi:response regulator [Oligoflexia bacterium]|nr:response regulator [Oligoflexia bacterium]